MIIKLIYKVLMKLLIIQASVVDIELFMEKLLSGQILLRITNQGQEALGHSQHNLVPQLLLQ